MDKKKEPAPTLVVRRVVQAERDRVFQAWTNPEMMKEWFHPMGGRSIVTNELKVNGSYRNEMIFASDGQGCGSGHVSDQKQHVVHEGRYLEIVPPEKIVFTWSSPIVTDSQVSVTLKDLGDSTEITITHELLETEDLCRQHNGGWDSCLDSFESYLN